MSADRDDLDGWGAALGKVEPEDGHYRWTCDICQSSDTHLNEHLAALALHIHITHGCAHVVDVQIPE